jgi:hypothetical protein
MKTPTRPRRAPALALLALVFLALLAAGAGPAAACPVCYGNAEGQMIDGAKASVAFMGLLVYALMGGGVAMVVVVRRRALREGEQAPSPGVEPRVDRSGEEGSNHA